MLYKHFLKPIFFSLDPEFVHDRMTSNGEFFGNHAFTHAIIGGMYNYHGPDISKTIDGIRYRTPFLLSAGFDYNGHLSKILPQIGLGGEEIGSVTARPCEGNPKPRLTRLPKSKSILVNKGLRNDGVDAIIQRLKGLSEDVFSRLLSERAKASEKEVPAEHGRTPVAEKTRPQADRFVIGISIARTNDELSVPIEKGIEDYAYSFKRLNEENVGDYYTINISCPNAYGAEAFNDPRLLTRLLGALKEIPCKKPVYIKMPINISWTQFEALLKIIDQYGLQGVVIGNLNKDYNSLDFRNEAPVDFAGGLSGKPCAALSTELIRKTRQAYGKRFTIIGVGGVMSPQSAMEKFEAGADLIQLISGLIFEGPGLIRKLCRAYYNHRNS